MSVKVNIKWGKELYKDVEVKLDGGASEFRQQLFSLTNVEPENQKVMGKGVTLKDTDWEGFKKALVNNGMLMMMGTPSQVVKAVTETATTTFMEDLPEEAQVMIAENLLPGLTNLGNTCYMNAALQMMNAMPELHDALEAYKKPEQKDPESLVTLAMKDVIRQLRTQKQAVTPFMFLAMLRQSFPQFAEQVGGHYAQQCADECWVQLVQCFKRLPPIKTEPVAHGASGIEQLLQGQFVTTSKCMDAPDEEPRVEYEPFESLHCHIDQKVSFLYQGINLGLNDTVVKNSPSLKTDANYSLITRINRLPYYLVVQFVRFEWKKGAKGGVRTKILRPVEFPFEFDTHDFCSDPLKEKLKDKRELVRLRADAPAAERKPIEQAPLTNETGIYELAAVLTHQGRDADGGHYISWVRQEGDKWLEFDDDKVSVVGPEDIKKLVGHGGADWHQAYMCLYRTKQFK